MLFTPTIAELMNHTRRILFSVILLIRAAEPCQHGLAGVL